MYIIAIVVNLQTTVCVLGKRVFLGKNIYTYIYNCYRFGCVYKQGRRLWGCVFPGNSIRGGMRRGSFQLTIIKYTKCILYANIHTSKFRGSPASQKYFNNEHFPNYGIYIYICCTCIYLLRYIHCTYVYSCVHRAPTLFKGKSLWKSRFWSHLRTPVLTQTRCSTSSIESRGYRRKSELLFLKQKVCYLGQFHF